MIVVYVLIVQQKGMIAMVVIGALMAVWVTVMLFMERHHAKKHQDVIDAIDSVSAKGVDHERVIGSSKGLDNKV